MFKFILFYALVVGYCSALSMPSYLKPCRKSDPDFNKCALKHAKEAIPFLVKGDKTYKIPNMMPMNLPLIEIQAGNNFKLRLRDLNVYGLENTDPREIDVDFDKQKIRCVLKIDRITILGDYDIDGKILLLPITGKGPANITIDGGDYVFKFDWILEKKDGVDYAKMQNLRLDYTVGRVYYDFKNLFNGDPTLGPQMNKFMNENWMEMHKDLKESVGETVATIYQNIASNFYNLIPYESMFLK